MTNTWPEFLSQIRGKGGLTLVGPLHDGPIEFNEPTVFIDGGARFRSAFPAGIRSISVGDGDSGGEPLDVRLSRDKDFSDLAYVLRGCPSHVTRLRMFGFLGGSFDHELANLGEIHEFLEKRGAPARAEMYRQGHPAVVGFVGSIESVIHGRFSLLTLTTTRVQIMGSAQFTLPQPTELTPASSRGISNRGSGTVTVQSDGPCFLFL